MLMGDIQRDQSATKCFLLHATSRSRRSGRPGNICLAKWIREGRPWGADMPSGPGEGEIIGIVDLW
jgi:hypothetical protein